MYWIRRMPSHSFCHLFFIQFWQKSLFIFFYHCIILTYWLVSSLWRKHNCWLDPELVFQKSLQLIILTDLAIFREIRSIGLSNLFVIAPCAINLLLNFGVLVLDSRHFDRQRCVPHDAFRTLTFAEVILPDGHGRFTSILLNQSLVHGIVLFGYLFIGLLKDKSVGNGMGLFVSRVALLIFYWMRYFLFGIDVLNRFEFLLVSLVILLDLVDFH